eukprot:scaffold12747_cov78-Skeletonema_dohrnii-CCMP3373.AAC.4
MCYSKCESGIQDALKLAIFVVQAKSPTTFFLFQKKQSWRPHLVRGKEHLSQPFIQSCRQTAHEKCQKVVGGHLSLLAELIIFPEGKCTHHLLANKHADQLASARPLSYRRLQQYSPTAPSRLTSSFVKQACRYQDDQKVSSMFHDSFCCGKEQPMRSNNNFSAVEAGAIQIGPAPWKPVLYKLAHHRRGKPAINKLALDTLKLKVKRPVWGSGEPFSYRGGHHQLVMPREIGWWKS